MPGDEDALDQLLDYAAQSGRVGPLPRRWDRFWETLLPEQKKNGGWAPPALLILAALDTTGNEQKRTRFAEHIRFANDQGLFATIDAEVRSLSEEDWHHSEAGLDGE